MSNKEHHYNIVQQGPWRDDSQRQERQATTASPKYEHISGFVFNPIFVLFLNTILF